MSSPYQVNHKINPDDRSINNSNADETEVGKTSDNKKVKVLDTKKNTIKPARTFFQKFKDFFRNSWNFVKRISVKAWVGICAGVVFVISAIAVAFGIKKKNPDNTKPKPDSKPPKQNKSPEPLKKRPKADPQAPTKKKNVAKPTPVVQQEVEPEKKTKHNKGKGIKERMEDLTRQPSQPEKSAKAPETLVNVETLTSQFSSTPGDNPAEATPSRTLRASGSKIKGLQSKLGNIPMGTPRKPGGLQRPNKPQTELPKTPTKKLGDSRRGRARGPERQPPTPRKPTRNWESLIPSELGVE